MSPARKPKGPRPCGKSLLGCLRHFLTPAVWKQARQAERPRHGNRRWTPQPLLLVFLALTWGCGDSLAERFETARAFAVVCLPTRKRPGRTVQGFEKAARRLPLGVFRAVAAAVRRGLGTALGERLLVAGFRPFGCDGSRVTCPRSQELEQRLGCAGKTGSAPSVWVTALVHLRTGLLWSWQVGKGTANEQHHLQRLLPTLPTHALVVADAAFGHYLLAWSILMAGASFLLRLSSGVTLYTEHWRPLSRWREGTVLFWPRWAWREGLHPLKARLIRVRSRTKRADVWLLTDVRSRQVLPASTAARFYRMRWENEGLFRTFKQTLRKVKLASRTVRLVHREAEAALLAVQLLLAQGTWALATTGQAEAVVSARQVVVEIRREIHAGLGPRQRRTFFTRLTQAQRERRQRTSGKVRYRHPGRRDHRPPQPPKLRKLRPELKALICWLENAA